MPEEPRGSSAAPTLYQIICVTTGSAMVRDDEDLKTVAKREFDDAGARLGAVHGHGKRHGGEAEGGEDQARTSIERARKLIKHRHHHGS